MDVQGPFYPLAKAAEYCGYAPSTFERVVREFEIPRHGPRKNRFAASVLDAWMVSPDTFKKQAQRARRYKPKHVTA